VLEGGTEGGAGGGLEGVRGGGLMGKRVWWILFMFKVNGIAGRSVNMSSRIIHKIKTKKNCQQMSSILIWLAIFSCKKIFTLCKKLIFSCFIYSLICINKLTVSPERSLSYKYCIFLFKTILLLKKALR
jgi:hypothetical protein